MSTGNATRWRVARRRTRLFVATAAVLATALAAPSCAARGAGRAGARPIDIRVQNNLVPPTSLSVSLIPAVGAKTFVGVIAPSQTKTLRMNPGVAAGTCRLLAETTDGSAIASRQPGTAAAHEAFEESLTQD